jgi:4-hydroxy-tetrahydrodipicolinate synthase
MALFNGLSAFPITPTDQDGRVDEKALARLVQRLVEADVESIGLLGSTGTYAYLTRDARRRAIEAGLEAAAGGCCVMVGIGALRTDEAVRLGEDARAAGAHAVLLAPVTYTPLTDEEVAEHFLTVASEVGLPLCIYNNPTTTHFAFSDELVARLSQTPNIVALKTPAPTGDQMGRDIASLRARAAPGFSLGYSGDWRATEALIAGGDAWYSVVAGVFPGPCRDIVHAVARGDIETARRLDRKLQPLWDLFQEFTSLRVVYAVANLFGLCAAQPPRPISPLSGPARARVAAVLESLAPLDSL